MAVRIKGKIGGRIVIDEKIRHGKPIIKGTRITIDEILGALIGGMSFEEIEREYGIKKEDIIAVLEFAASFIRGEEIKYYPFINTSIGECIYS